MTPDRLETLLGQYPILAPHRIDLAPLPCHAVAPGSCLFRAHDPCQGFPLLLSGEVRVIRVAPSGRALELYRVLPGDICLVSSASLFSDQALSAQGETTGPTELVLMPPGLFRRALAREDFRDFVLGLFAARMADLSGLVEAVAFQKLDARLAGTLLGHGPEVHTTHQALADELGTARETVTRLLKRFERDGWIELERECVRIRDSAALRRQADDRP